MTDKVANRRIAGREEVKCEGGTLRVDQVVPLPECEHNYQTVHEDWESETLQCSKCGDRYKLYDDEMR